MLFHIAANIHRRTANGRPYGCDYKTVLSFREWQSPKTSAENNRADAKTATAVFNADRFPAAAGRRTANGRPYGCDYKTVLSFREWQSPKTSAENNRADAKTATAVFNADRFPAAAGRRTANGRPYSAFLSHCSFTRVLIKQLILPMMIGHREDFPISHRRGSARGSLV